MFTINKGKKIRNSNTHNKSGIISIRVVYYNPIKKKKDYK